MHRAEADPAETFPGRAGTRFRLLGPLEVSGPGGSLRLTSARQRALLALLAVRAPEVVSRAHLVDALWGTSPPPTAIKTLHSHIARVRQALNRIGLSDLLVTREPGYALVLQPSQVDASVFAVHVSAGQHASRRGNATEVAQRLSAGLALWRGDPLADCPVLEWGQAEIARLQDARAGAEEALAEAQLVLGEHVRLAGELERLVVRYPLRERFWELLVIAHHRGGRQGEALQAYRRARTVLVEELGVEPGPGLRRLEAAVLTGAAELDPATARPRTVLAAPGPQPSADLPGMVTDLVGRTRELPDVVRLLRESRLVTLTGPGGCGKTQLALRAGMELADRDGVAVTLVDLTPVHEPDLVVDSFAAATGVAERPGADLADGLIKALADRDLLLLVDNCEHLVRACADLVSRLLKACPRVNVLATSREALRCNGEASYEVPPLAVPDPGVPRTLAELSAYDSVQLFLDRTGQSFTDDDAQAIAQLCAALDGLPLAIELAAARSSILAPAQIVTRLRDRFGLLTTNAWSARPHHQALRAAVAWSYDLLTPAEATLFARLSVFASGFSVEAAEAVGDPGETLDALTGLVGKSLVRVQRHGGATRFTMLETISAYAAERLAADREAQANTRCRHAQFFLDLAEQANADPTGEQLAQLRIEHDNLRLAISWFAAAPSTGLLRLAAALNRYCYLNGHYREGRQWLDQALAQVGEAPTDLRVKALAGAASMALYQCDYAEAARYATEGLRLATNSTVIGRLQRLLGSVAREQADYASALRFYASSRDSFSAESDAFGVAYSFVLTGATAWLSGDLAAAESALHTSLDQLRALADAEGIASSLAYLGAVAHYRGADAEARKLLDEALNTFSSLGFKEGIAWALNLLGLVDHRAGDHEQATRLLQTSLALHRELGDRWREASILEALAAVACSTGEPDRAASLLHQAEQMREQIGAPVPMIERRALAQTLCRSRSRRPDQQAE